MLNETVPSVRMHEDFTVTLEGVHYDALRGILLAARRHNQEALQRFRAKVAAEPGPARRYSDEETLEEQGRLIGLLGEQIELELARLDLQGRAR